MDRISVRYIVDDVDVAAAYYADVLGFELVMRPAPGFAMLERGDLRLLLNAPGAGAAGATLSDGSVPAPGGWNRFQLGVDDLDAALATVTAAGGELRGDVVEGRGGRQGLVADPSGNLIELFETFDS
jgi:catechol 2,3-dioxygenase-like lactoylglutathione lyase family enzyme